MRPLTAFLRCKKQIGAISPYEQKILILQLSERNSIGALWSTFQNGITEIVYAIDEYASMKPGSEKKLIAMTITRQFYWNVIAPVPIPYIPHFLKPLFNIMLEKLFMALASGSIDATVKTINLIRRK